MTAPPEHALVLDDRASGTLAASLGTRWRFVGDGVMGGVSEGRLTTAQVDGRPCLRLAGLVSTANNGGFIQMQLPLARSGELDASAFTGIWLTVRGNGELYNLHLKTPDLGLPWQSYRSEFIAGPAWQRIELPFAGFRAHRTAAPLDLRRLQRLGLVGIGRPFSVDVCVAEVGLYR